MRRIATLLLGFCFAVIVATPARAVTLMTEEFIYVNGGLVAVSGGNWTMHSGTTDIVVSSGRAVGVMSNSADDNRTFAPQSATAKTYACFNVLVPTPGSAPVLNYFAHFKDTGTLAFVARVYVAPSGGTFTFGLSVGSCSPTGTPACSPILWPVALSYETQYQLVIKYDAAAGSATLWVNPVSEASTSISHSTWSGTASQVGTLVSAFALRQSSAGVPSGTSGWGFSVDNIAVGQQFDFICPAPTPIEQSTWGRMKVLYR